MTSLYHVLLNSNNIKYSNENVAVGMHLTNCVITLNVIVIAAFMQPCWKTLIFSRTEMSQDFTMV